MDSGKPTLINAVIDPAAGSESGRIGNLNPQSALQEEIDAMQALRRRRRCRAGAGSKQTRDRSGWPRRWQDEEPRRRAKPAAKKSKRAKSSKLERAKKPAAKSGEGERQRPAAAVEPSPTARPARRSTACASSTSRTCSRARPARSCSPGSAPTCIKVERPGVGDITRGQLRRREGRGLALLHDAQPQQALDHDRLQAPARARRSSNALIKHCDVLVENFAPGALDRMGLTWEHIHKLNPRMIVASVKGFGPGPYEDCKVYENVAQCAGGSASTTGFRDGPPLVTGAQIGDCGTGLHLALGIVSALYQRNRTGRGQKVLCAMQDGVLNLCARQAARPAAAQGTARSPNTASTARAFRSARRRRAPATIPAAASPAGSSSARAGRTIPTPTSISSPRRRCGGRSAT